jgi:hypothetical protein
VREDHTIIAVENELSTKFFNEVVGATRWDNGEWLLKQYMGLVEDVLNSRSMLLMIDAATGSEKCKSPSTTMLVQTAQLRWRFCGSLWWHG